MKNPVENELMTMKEVMALVRYSKPSIYRLMSDGKFPKSITLGGRSVFWVRSQIQEFIQGQIKKSNKDAA